MEAKRHRHVPDRVQARSFVSVRRTHTPRNDGPDRENKKRAGNLSATKIVRAAAVIQLVWFYSFTRHQKACQR